jgi:ribosomal protein S18 acetylase RimI-like enzyme
MTNLRGRSDRAIVEVDVNQSTLATVNCNAIAGAFNAVYEDYVMPVHLTAEQIEHHITGNDINLTESPLWLDDNGTVVGMAMLGIRDDRGWVGGFGIAKPYRGRGLSHQLIQDVIQRGRNLNLREISLEVITTNAAAIRTYQRAGFTHNRDLLILIRRPAELTLDIDTTAVTPADPSQLLANRPQSTESPAWQHDQRSLAGDTNLTGLTLGPAAAPLAMAVYLHPDDTSIRIADLAAIDQESAQTLLAALIQRHPATSIALINEPEASNALPALSDLGWHEVMRQHEMVLPLRDA